MARKKKEFDEAQTIRECNEHFSMYYQAFFGPRLANGEAFDMLYYPDAEMFDYKDEKDQRNYIMKKTFANGYFDNVLTSKKFQSNLLKQCQYIRPTNPLRAQLMAKLFKNCYEEWVKYLDK